MDGLMLYINPMFTVVLVISILIFVLSFSIILVVLIRNLSQWNRNNHSPRLTVPASVVAKRTNVSRNRSGSTSSYYSSTTYYVTFQVDSGDRFELQLQGYEYGLLVEGDRGMLSFQGTRYLGFQRA